MTWVKTRISRYLHTLHPEDVRLAVVCDNYSLHMTTKRCRRVADWAETDNVGSAYTPTNFSLLDRIEAHAARNRIGGYKGQS